MRVTFFGHRDAPESLYAPLKEVLTDLIEHRGADSFYVGNEGVFDRLVQKVLRELSVQYPHIECTVVLAYLPRAPLAQDADKYESTLYPEAAANAPARFAIDRRNRFMIEESDLAVTFVKTSYGGAAKAKALTQRKGKQILELAKISKP